MSISVGGAIVFIVGSLNDQEFSSMEGTVGREVVSYPTELEFVNAVTDGGSVKFLPAV